MTEAIILHGIIYSLLLTAIMFGVTLKNPRIMLHAYPKSIREKVAPLNRKEKQAERWFNIIFLIFFVSYPLACGWYYQQHISLNFWQLSAFIWGILLVFNLFDLLIVDWLIICFITPEFIILSGTKGNKGYKDYRYHFIAFIKGIFMTLGIAIMIMGLIRMIFFISKLIAIGL